MPDADAQLMAAQQAQRLVVEMQAADAEKLELSKHANTAGRLYRLMTDDDFVWFLETFVDPLIEAEDKVLNDLDTPSAKRDIACHRKSIAKTIRSLVEAKHKEFLAKANPSEPKAL